MMKRILTIIILILFVACESPKQFTEEALNETLLTLEDSETNLKNVLEQYKGKKILIDVWASWCKDCIKGMPKVKELQEEFPNVVFLFLSEDTTVKRWKSSVNKLQIDGDHYYIKSGTDGAFKDFLNSNWIPRYMVVDEDGNITLFKAKTASDKRIKEFLK